MLKGRNSSNEYWAKAVACAIYVINISPIKSVINRVPKEARSSMSCSVSRFIIFGCVSYAHVPKQIQRKLDDQSEKCIFIGYSEQSKAYKLYNPVIKKTIINRDFVFKKQESWNGTEDKTIERTRTIDGRRRCSRKGVARIKIVDTKQSHTNKDSNIFRATWIFKQINRL